MTKRKKRLAIIIVLVFICGIGIGAFVYLSKVFSVDNTRWWQFYNEEQGTIDGIYMGSSAAYDFWMPTKAYEEYGFCIYNLGTTVQPLCIEKNLIKEAIHHQENIEVIVIELKNLVRVEQDDMGRYIRLATDNLKLQRNRFEAINTALDYYKASGADISYNKAAYYFPALRALRYKDHDISKSDWLLEPGTPMFKGYNRAKGNEITVLKAPETYEETYPLSKEKRKAVEDLLDYCSSLEQTVIFVSVPFNPIEKERYRLGMIKEACNMCEERGFITYNFNEEPLKERLGIDWENDYYDRAHANIYGAQKYTLFLADLISKEVNLPDHRGETGKTYDSWGKEAKHLNDYLNELEQE